MNYKKRLAIPLMILSLNTLSFATIYSDGEDGTVGNWKVHDNKPAGAVVSNVIDEIKNSKVIELKGEGRLNSYMLGGKDWRNTREKVLKWSMKFSEKFKITLYIKTKKGLRTLFYDYKNKDKGFYQKKYIKIGLGKQSMGGTWQKFSRDIEADLKKYEPDNELIKIKGMKVQGSGRMDDVRLEKKEDNDPNNALVIAKAKDVCINGKRDQKVVCMATRQMVYLLDDRKALYAVSTSGNWSVIGKQNVEKYNILFSKIKQIDHSPLLYLETSDGNGGRDEIYYTDINTKQLHKLLSFKTGHHYSITSVRADKRELIIEGEDRYGQNHSVKTYDISKLPKITEIDKGNDFVLIKKAKEHCLGEDKSTSSILCSNEKNIVYLVDTEKIDFERDNNNIYRVSIEKNQESVEIISKNIETNTIYPRERLVFIKLKNTPIYLKKFLSIGADTDIDWSFMYKGKALFSQHSNDNDKAIYDIHTDASGKKLIFSYDQEYVDPYGKYTLTYDISNPNKMVLIDKIINNLH